MADTMGAVDRRSYLPREEAFALCSKLEAVGVLCDLVAHRHGWRIEVQPHTDLVKLVEVCKAEDLNVLFRPFGSHPETSEWPMIVIYSGSKP